MARNKGLLAVLLACCLSSQAAAALLPPSFSDALGHIMRMAFGAAAGPDAIPNTSDGEPASDIHVLPAKRDFDDGDDASVRRHWALLVAGSSGWGNYRHQADVCHAYQVLRRGGLLPQYIVTMVFDDIAHDMENPFPGKVFNRPGGPDVYGGVRVDYRGADMTAANFLAVLEGNSSRMEGIGSGRVIASGPHDRIFVFYSDHGAPGVLGMPAGPFLYADEMVNALGRKHRAHGYKEAALYIEACESGSMFEGLLANNIGIYATTASNAFESSWGTYCPGMSPAPPPPFSTCLGDLYSVAWMENAEEADLSVETLLDQYVTVRNRTSANYTYVMGSHVMQYGSLDMDVERAGDYEGMRNKGRSSSGSLARRLLEGVGGLLGREWGSGAQRQRQAEALAGQGQGGMASLTASVEQRAADLVHLRTKAAHTEDAQERERAQAALDAELARRQAIDAAASGAASRLLLHPAAAPLLAAHLGVARGALYALPASAPDSSAAASNALQPQPALVRALVEQPLGGRPGPGLPLVDDWGCLRAMVGAWEGACGRMGDYGMRHTRLMANLCNAHVQPAALAQALAAGGECGSAA